MKLAITFLLFCLSAVLSVAAAKTPGEVEIGSVLREAQMQGLLVPNRKLSAFRGKPLLINVWASWCGPCKQLSPILKEWVKAQNGKVELIEIDVDENQELAKSKKIEAIPYLEMYKNGVKTWSSVGLIGKEELDKSVDSSQ